MERRGIEVFHWEGEAATFGERESPFHREDKKERRHIAPAVEARQSQNRWGREGGDG